MHTLAHWNDDGPGPWILLFPLMWALVLGGLFFFVRRVVWRGRGAPWQRFRGGPGGPGGPGGAGYGEQSPIAVLGRRFAAGEIDEDEYWRRLSVLSEEFGRHTDTKGGAA
ncbi:SHOCT domain-containing protein [Streptomyces synnematoformans]|uniref:SHOCT domain-containing protein n=1 Tax=Streptomyces synnematoformans TaxID=415721 RepID=A0ABN2YLN2_9ACTN